MTVFYSSVSLLAGILNHSTSSFSIALVVLYLVESRIITKNVVDNGVSSFQFSVLNEQRKSHKNDLL